jgi:hypothetical protein
MTMATRRAKLGRAAGIGVAAGLAGVAVMTAAEQVEQVLTGRPSSYVPGRTLLTLLGLPASDAEQPPGWNHAMHWGTGALLGALRGVWAATGIRGAEANTTHTAVRLAFDQTLENATGAGAPPSTWPAGERIVDATHKAIYSFVTGVVADRMITPALRSQRGIASH